MDSSNKHWHRSMAIAVIALTVASHASADVVATAINNRNYTWTTREQVALPDTVTPYFAHSGGRLVATYSAQCAVDAPAGNTTAYVEVDIVVRNEAGAIVATLSPTAGQMDVFCSANGTQGFDGWGTYAVAGVVSSLAAGVYRVHVLSRMRDGATGGFMGRRSLVVSR